MQSGTAELTAMMNRLERLEKQNRRFKQIGALALVFLGSVLLMGQAGSQRTVEANEFVMKDTEGRVRAKLSSTIFYTGLFFYDENGKMRGNFVLNRDEGPSLSLYDKNQNARIQMRARTDSPRGIDEPAIALMDRNGKVRARLSLDTLGQIENDVPTLRFFDVKENLRVTLNASKLLWGLHVHGDLEIKGDNFVDFGGASLGMGANGPMLDLWDKEGFQATIGTTDLVTPRTGETSKTSAASVVLFDKDKKVLWKAP